MASLRQHGTTLIAGLVFLGVLALIGASARTHLGAGPWTGGAIWFGAAFLAAHIVRRYLPELETSALCSAALVMATIGIGIVYRREHEPIDITILVELGLTFAGTLAGAFTARRATVVRPIFKVLGAGAVGFGAAVLGVGIGLLLDGEPVVQSFFVAAPLGAVLATWLSDAEAHHSAFGQALYFALISFVPLYSRNIVGGLILAFVSAVVGWLLGAIGGAIGVKVRGTPRVVVPLPEARKVD